MRKLQTWIESGNKLCLDLRTKVDFTACHLKSSTNIPLSQLFQRQSELPPKRSEFAVIEPLDAEGCSSWLTEHGWQTPWVVWEGQIEWNEAIKNQWTSSSSDIKEQCLLFQPSPFLEHHIDTIEESLPQDRDWRCLDVGCGAGRDTGWILSRGKQWKVSAIDSLEGALRRTDTIVKNLGVDEHMELLAQAKLLPNGEWQLISSWTPPSEGDLESIVSFSEMYTNLVPGNATFDLILNIRFLSKPFLLQVPDMLNVGGYFVISHFVDDPRYDYKQPKPSLRLKLNEISELFEGMSNMEVVKDVIEESEDGRPLNSISVRRIK